MKIKLQAIKHYKPCLAGWTTLLKHLGKTEADDAPISLLTILESNGFEDALLCLRAVEGFDREKRLFAVFCAKQVKHLMHDKRSLNAIEVAERYANGLATEKELKEASDAARAASAAWAAWAARSAWDASAASAVSADWASADRDAWYARVVASHAARDAASDASEAARDASEAAIRIEKEQEKEFVRMLNCIENGEVYTI